MWRKKANERALASVDLLREEVLKGNVTEVIYIAVGDDGYTLRALVGDSTQPFLLSKQLDVAKLLYNEERIFPLLLSEEYYIQED